MGKVDEETQPHKCSVISGQKGTERHRYSMCFGQVDNSATGKLDGSSLLSLRTMLDRLLGETRIECRGWRGDSSGCWDAISPQARYSLLT